MAQSQLELVHNDSPLDLPPPFEGRNVIELISSKDGRITHVRVYPSCAEVTRVFKVPVKVGNNQVVISGFPDALNDQSLRHESKGPASVRDVKISETPFVASPTTSPKLEELTQRRERLNNSLTRAYNGTYALEDYLEDMKKNSPSDLKDIAEEYMEATTELDDRIAELKKEIAALDKGISEERKVLSGPVVEVKYDFIKVTLGLFGEAEGEVDLTLHYVVNHASWVAAYDIRFDKNNKEKRATLVYKASITQSTGESWDAVPIILDTSTPTTASYITKMYPWRLSMYTAPPPPPPPGQLCSPQQFVPYVPTLPPATPFQPYQGYYPSVDSLVVPAPVTMNTQRRRRSRYSSLGWGPTQGVTATFDIPGLTSIATDGQKHLVNVMELEMDAEAFWCAAPRNDTTMYFKMKVKNTTKYPLKPGAANVYLDGSLVSYHSIPLVCPNETFECPLGIDSSIRAEYHPINEKTSNSKFLSIPFKAKVTKHTFTQTISVVNTKSYPVSGVKISDHIPVSDDSSIRVTLLSPSLPVPGKSELDLKKVVTVSPGVVVQWDEGNSGAGWDTRSINGAEDGLMSWTCTIPAESKVELVLRWEVKAPKGKTVIRLRG
ncbi:hypothetical protein BDQ17DRAFT_1246877 [Cyathus striatus]|nr:hypothetical protein BDQ17DRAFT_1246877 [Cyathus striatus]